MLGQLSTYESAPNLSDEHNVEGNDSLAKPGGPSRCVNCAGRKWWKTATSGGRLLQREREGEREREEERERERERESSKTRYSSEAEGRPASHVTHFGGP